MPASPALAPYNAVQFVYGTRADVTPIYQGGSLQQTTVILTDIKTVANGIPVYDYKLGYAPGTPTRHSELTSVTLCAGDGGGCSIPCNNPNVCVATTSFGWQGTRDTVTLSAPVATTISTGTNLTSSVVPGDFNGDGLTDALPMYMPSACDIYVGTAGGAFAAGGFSASYKHYDSETGLMRRGSICFNDIQYAPPNVPLVAVDIDSNGIADVNFTTNWQSGIASEYFLKNDGVSSLTDVNPNNKIPAQAIQQFGDFNGDGIADFFSGSIVDGQPSYFYIGDGAGNFMPGTGQSGLGGTLATRIPLDFDGDGCTDIMVQGRNYTPHVVFAGACTPHQATLGVTDWVGDGYSIALGDFNGDGKTDVLQTDSGTDPAIMYLSTGNSLATAWQSADKTVDGIDISQYAIYTGDFNGDGKADLLLIADGVQFGSTFHTGGAGSSNYVLLSTGPSGFVVAASFPNSGDPRDNPLYGIPAIRPVIADWNNDGAADIWLLKPSGDQIYTVSYTPELMTTISNGLGTTTTVTYDRLNKNATLYAKCANSASYVSGDTYPTQDVDGPFYVVSRVDSSNGVGGTYSSTYSYGQAKADLKGRGFLGFTQMTITDLQTQLQQITTYNTAFPYIGLVASQTKTCPAGVCTIGAVTLSSTTNTYETVGLGTGTDNVNRVFVGLRQSVSTANDADGSPLPTVTTTYTYDCDTGGPVPARRPPATATPFPSCRRPRPVRTARPRRPPTPSRTTRATATGISAVSPKPTWRASQAPPTSSARPPTPTT
jgi:glycosyltransferase TcdB-like subunit of Tc toxin/VCBS repeat protein